MTRKSNIALGLVLVIGLGAGPVLASGYVKPSEEKQTEIRTKLTAEGYEVRKIEMEDGLIEVYAIKDGTKYELYLDADLNVQRSKQKD